MVLVQIVYERLGKYREQFSFVGGHALTLDAYDIERGFYPVDPIPKPGSGYKGRWIPSAVIRDATDAMSGSGWVYAAWAKPKATPPPPEEDMDIYATPGRISYTAPVGTPVYRNPGDAQPAATIPDGAKRFDGVVHPGKADGSGPDKSWTGLDGISDDPTRTEPARIGWVRTSALRDPKPIVAAPKSRKVVVTVDGVKVTPDGTVTL
jgi:hypothetical protein